MDPNQDNDLSALIPDAPVDQSIDLLGDARDAAPSGVTTAPPVPRSPTPPPVAATAATPSPTPATGGVRGVWAGAQPTTATVTVVSPQAASAQPHYPGAGAGAGAGVGVAAGGAPVANAADADGMRRRMQRFASGLDRSGDQFLEVPVDRWKYDGAMGATELTTVLRYTPSHIQYRVPPLRFGRSAPIRLMIVVTMYAESPSELDDTLQGIAQNIHEMNAEVTAGGDNAIAWHEVCVVIVSDGIKKINNDTLRRADELGIAKQAMIFHAEDLGMVEPDGIELHEFTAAPCLEPATRAWKKKYGARYCPMQVVFAIKEHNGGKLDSHKWFFDAYCRRANPEFVVLVDVGTRPSSRAIYNLVATMRNDDSVGGCCGEIAVGLQPGHKSEMYTNFVISAQQFEYKISHCMDKPLESVLGFITVLPGAFSAYRYTALVGDGHMPPGYHAPLDKYFASLPDPNNPNRTKSQDAFDANMYLAEDRILCFEIVATKGRAYKLQFVKNSPAYTDVPTKLATLLKQRRRWLNGSFFAMLYALIHFRRIFQESTHSCMRKFLLGLELLYFLANVFVTWFLIGSFYLSFKLCIVDTLGVTGGWSVLGYFLTVVYHLTTVLVFVLSLGNDPVWTRRAFRWCAYVYAAMLAVVTVLIVVGVIHGGSTTGAILAALAMFLTFSFAGLIHGQLQYIIPTFIQYYFFVPTFIMVFTIFSFSNIHDVSWGTKGLDKVQGRAARRVRNAPPKPLEQMNEAERMAYEKRESEAADRERRELQKAAKENDQHQHEFRWYRTCVVMLLIATNLAYVSSIDTFVIANGYESVYLKALAGIVFFMIGARLLGSIAFQLQRFGYITCCAGERKRIKQQARAQYVAPSAGLLANDGQTTIGGEAFA